MYHDLAIYEKGILVKSVDDSEEKKIFSCGWRKASHKVGACL
jgi:hypothetical protein